MNSYDIIKNLIRFSPIIIMLFVYFWLLKGSLKKRLLMVVFIGWVSMVIFSLLYWKYAISFAPNEEVKGLLASKDGAPKVMALLFGWVYSIIIFAILELLKVLVTQFIRVYKNLTTRKLDKK